MGQEMHSLVPRVCDEKTKAPDGEMTWSRSVHWVALAAVVLGPQGQAKVRRGLRPELSIILPQCNFYSFLFSVHVYSATY